ncbi:MAG: Rrf2 family transcriptional regulator [bacterium]
MRFTAQEEYGLRCMVQLARHEVGGPLTIQAIAQAERLSPAYVGKLLGVLRRHGLVASQHGPSGGYRLPRPAAEMNVGEILNVLGGRLFEPRICKRYGGERPLCVHTSACSIHSLWSGLDLIVDQLLKKTRLSELVSGERTVSSWIREQLPAILDTAGRRAALPLAAAERAS